MEGLAGVVTGSDVSENGRDYEHFRKIMAGETNAAVEGAFAAGASEVVVRDSHGAKQNLLPADVHPRARLLRGATSAPKNMMEGIDASFAAAVFIGYHAKAGTPDAILAHTSNGNVIDVSINGTSLPEAGYNALAAGLYGVPVVFASGDLAFVEQVKTLLGPIDHVAVKEAIGGGGVLSLSPEHARDRIRAGVEGGVRNRVSARVFKMTPPYSMVLKVRTDKPLIAGATRPRPGESLFSSNDLLEVLAAFNAMK
jgi:D-amino peptidase